MSRGRLFDKVECKNCIFKGSRYCWNECPTTSGGTCEARLSESILPSILPNRTYNAADTNVLLTIQHNAILTEDG